MFWEERHDRLRHRSLACPPVRPAPHGRAEDDHLRAHRLPRRCGARSLRCSHGEDRLLGREPPPRTASPRASPVADGLRRAAHMRRTTILVLAALTLCACSPSGRSTAEKAETAAVDALRAGTG